MLSNLGVPLFQCHLLRIVDPREELSLILLDPETKDVDPVVSESSCSWMMLFSDFNPPVDETIPELVG